MIDDSTHARSKTQELHVTYTDDSGVKPINSAVANTCSLPWQMWISLFAHSWLNKQEVHTYIVEFIYLKHDYKRIKCRYPHFPMLGIPILIYSLVLVLFSEGVWGFVTKMLPFHFDVGS